MLYAYFFFNDTATTEIYTLSLHDALPICLDAGSALRDGVRDSGFQDRLPGGSGRGGRGGDQHGLLRGALGRWISDGARSEEHTSELQSRQYLVCRLLLEKKKLYSYNLQQL